MAFSTMMRGFNISQINIDECGGDAESGPITFSHCVDCGKTFKQ